MRRLSETGFTLVELLISIAIIGILTSVLVPNLVSARSRAHDRAAQEFSKKTYTTIMAALAEDIDAIPSDFNGDCMSGGNFGPFSISSAPQNVLTCAVVGNNATGTVNVTVTTDQLTIVNGQL